jgi:hypothetical protein
MFRYVVRDVNNRAEHRVTVTRKLTDVRSAHEPPQRFFWIRTIALCTRQKADIGKHDSKVVHTTTEHRSGLSK